LYHDITEILLKVALNTTTLTLDSFQVSWVSDISMTCTNLQIITHTGGYGV